MRDQQMDRVASNQITRLAIASLRNDVSVAKGSFDRMRGPSDAHAISHDRSWRVNGETAQMAL
jgi:hypothetical protein